MAQAAVSQLEQRTGVYLSTFENFSEAMGGRLETQAVFPDKVNRPLPESIRSSAQATQSREPHPAELARDAA